MNGGETLWLPRPGSNQAERMLVDANHQTGKTRSHPDGNLPR